MRLGHISVGWLWAETFVSKPQPSQTPSIIPATKAAQLSMFISRGTLIYVLTRGSLSVIMYSLGVSGETECSRASAARWNSKRQSGPWMRWRSARMRSGRFGGEEEVEELVRAEDEVDVDR